VEIDVTGWLLVNSMRMEGLQYIQMSLQVGAAVPWVWKKRVVVDGGVVLGGGGG
jgi:hypothetical protein